MTKVEQLVDELLEETKKVNSDSHEPDMDTSEMGGTDPKEDHSESFGKRAFERPIPRRGAKRVYEGWGCNTSPSPRWSAWHWGGA